MPADRCSECGDNERDGHNYCRKCGFHLTQGYVQNAAVALAYYVGDKYCGYCGGKARMCRCSGIGEGLSNDRN
jgi:hypothetical protein